jgi:hypothetical protein
VENEKMNGAIMALVMLAVACMAAKKKREPRWIQATLTTGATKGAVDWLKPGTKIEPSTVHVATAKVFRDDGFHIPDFIEDGIECLILLDRTDLTRRPLLVHQKSALVAVFRWMMSITSVDDVSHPHIDTLVTDELWSLEFKRGKKKFDPYTMKAHDLDEGPGGPL